MYPEELDDECPETNTFWMDEEDDEEAMYFDVPLPYRPIQLSGIFGMLERKSRCPEFPDT